MVEIANILDGCSTNNILLNKTLIAKIIYILVKEFKLENYVKEVKFQKLRHTLAFHDNAQKFIAVDCNKCLDYGYESSKKLRSAYKLSNNDQYQIINLLIIHVILHEIEHAKQDKLYSEFNKNIIDNQLYKISINKYFRINDDITGKDHYKKIVKYLTNWDNKYHRNESIHNVYPIERMADIIAYKELIEIYNMTKSHNSLITYLLIIDYYSNLLNNYHINNNRIISPLTVYLDKKQKCASKAKLYVRDKEYRKLNNNIIYNYLDIETRMIYGIQISNDEYNKVADNINYYISKVKVK